jgi:hypothetical protein
MFCRRKITIKLPGAVDAVAAFFCVARSGDVWGLGRWTYHDRLLPYFSGRSSIG